MERPSAHKCRRDPLTQHPQVGLTKVQPSAKREGFATIPDVTWEDVGAMSNLRAEMNMAIVQPILTCPRAL